MHDMYMNSDMNLRNKISKLSAYKKHVCYIPTQQGVHSRITCTYMPLQDSPGTSVAVFITYLSRNALARMHLTVSVLHTMDHLHSRESMHMMLSTLHVQESMHMMLSTLHVQDDMCIGDAASLYIHKYMYVVDEGAYVCAYKYLYECMHASLQ